MKPVDFLKDRLPAYLIYVTAWFLALIFMSAFRISVQAIIIISFIFLLAVVSVQLWEFYRKKSYYDKLLHCLSELDKKYLLSEMTDTPDFYEGRILSEVMRETNKSMCEHIADYRRENVEFREYIELWVHEIKLPVAGLQLMCHNDGNTKYSEQLKRIDDYVENVLYYSRSGNAEKDYIIKEVSLKRAFIDAAVKNREELQERNINVRTENLDMNVMTDGKWLAFILGQLMGNSMRYTASDRSPKIFVYAEDSSDKIALHFRDNGIGIPESDLPYIFEKSFTGENGRIYSKSTGMGLYIVKKLCDKLGHGVSVKSVRGEYTEIIITFGKNDIYNVV